MTEYWIRQRLLSTIIMSFIVAVVTSLLFVFPSIIEEANLYNSQSIYKKSKIDFIAPEPSFEQVKVLPGSYGIANIFPFYLTKTQVNVKGVSRSTTVLLSDHLEDVEMTMYNKDRLIEQSKIEYDNPILADWQFCKDTSSNVGDTVFITIGGKDVEYKIYAVYETNSIYDGGAILAKITDSQRDTIAQQSNNNGYSGMYISADDYNECNAYLTTDYRPLGRLQDRDQFDSDEQYQVHYDAIMSTGFANEITDFRIRENSLEKKGSSFMVWLGALFAFVVIISFNLTMARRGCENVYFTKHCLPKGQNIKSYYSISFAVELLFTSALYAIFLLLRVSQANEFIPGTAKGVKVLIVPIAIIITEIACLIFNNSMVSEMTKKVELELKKQKIKENDSSELQSVVEIQNQNDSIIPDKDQEKAR